MTTAGPAASGPAELRTAGGLAVLGWPALDALGVDVVVTTRSGGISTGPYASLNLGLHVGDEDGAVLENRRRAAASLDATLDDLVLGAQVHGARVARVHDRHRGRGARRTGDALPGVDTLVTSDPGPVLAVLVADCVPVVLFDPDAGVLAAVHAGWRGTVAGAARVAVGAMCRLGARPERIVAGIGPAVPVDAYVVRRDVADAVAGRFGTRAGEVLVPAGHGRHVLDLPAANRLELLDAGVGAAAVHVASQTTADESFFSDRASRPCGRFALLARLRA